jgi:hypothetical protein
MSEKMSNWANDKIQREASNDHDRGEKNVPHRDFMDDVMFISDEHIEHREQVYRDAWDKCDQDRK